MHQNDNSSAPDAARRLTARQLLFRAQVSIGGWAKRLSSSEDCSDIPAKLRQIVLELGLIRHTIARNIAGVAAAWDAFIAERSDGPSARDREFFEAGYAAAARAAVLDAELARDGNRYRAVRQRAYFFGVGNPSPEQMDADVDAHLVASGAGRPDASDQAAQEALFNLAVRFGRTDKFTFRIPGTMKGHKVACVVLAPDELSAFVASMGRGAALASGGGNASASMPTAQEPKYGIRDNRLYNRASGEFIPFDEPVFIFRARDRLAASALEFYMLRCGSDEHQHAVFLRMADFENFADAHPDRMKWPDTDMRTVLPPAKGPQ